MIHVHRMLAARMQPPIRPWVVAVAFLAMTAPTAAIAKVTVESALLKTIEATTIAAEVSGTLAEMSVVEGERVSVAQLMGKVRDQAVQLQLTESRIALEIAQKKLASEVDIELAVKRARVAKNELERAVLANQRIADTYPAKEIDRLSLVAESADLEVQRARHLQDLIRLDVKMAENDLLKAEELLQRHQILSPVGGVVVSLNKRVGEWVEPGTELMRIVKIDRLRIEGFVSPEASGQKLMDQPATVTVLTGKQERQVTGEVVFVSPDANPINGRVRVFLEIDNTAGEFRPGMRVLATIIPAGP